MFAKQTTHATYYKQIYGGQEMERNKICYIRAAKFTNAIHYIVMANVMVKTKTYNKFVFFCNIYVT